ncbi:histidyl-tRNA synthetase [Jiangella alba]|uniref:Histidine--tRNA ligase n=2 Tax=Jiangella alba TaxID=561176 RepID=A0A1H5PRP7_9ACTN|nr:histidyl-tRNA synthetase [Jiangella alba]
MLSAVKPLACWAPLPGVAAGAADAAPAATPVRPALTDSGVFSLSRGEPIGEAMAVATSNNLTPASGTRDFLAAEVRQRHAAFATIREVFDRYGFEPLETPAFERLEVLTGKYGDEGDKLIFKILRRGMHEGSGEADLALRYDLTVPLTRVVAAYGSQLPNPYKRYAIAPVWRADRPGRGRFREFYQCDLDVVGSSSPLADAETVSALSDALTALGVPDFRFLVNSRNTLHGLLEGYEVPAAISGRVLIVLDKLDKLTPDDVTVELRGVGLDDATAKSVIADLTAEDAQERIRHRLIGTEIGRAGMAEIDQLLHLVSGQIARISFTPSLVRGLDYYTGVIYEVTAPGMPGSIASGGRYDGLVAKLGGPDLPACGGSLGIERILPLIEAEDAGATGADVAVTVIDDQTAADLFALVAGLRAARLRVAVYLGSSGKLSRQMKWANDQRAKFCLIYGRAEKSAGEVTVREMATGDQVRVPDGQIASYLTERCGL